MAITQDQVIVAEQPSDKLTLVPLTALVVGSMIGGGVFNLPSDMSRGASPAAILIGWVITGFGMLTLALVYQSLANRKPDLNAGGSQRACDALPQVAECRDRWKREDDTSFRDLGPH